MRKLLVPALVLVCLFAVNAIAVPAAKAAAASPKDVTLASTVADTGADDGMPRVARNQIRHTILHAKGMDDDVFSPDFGIGGNGGGGTDLTAWSPCSSGSRCSSDACTTENSTYNSCQYSQTTCRTC